ncbi:ABC transporter permease [Lacticaseibacillus yichunensis]|uniref:ABC transporter permease n=1 Tax=Lacticaseibacillus yichunensis TaxID=2486015 RepID=A0ABW4CRT6_9LACO|nr:ABC transporter permease [Lacticaseibacillus yichunensis]
MKTLIGQELYKLAHRKGTWVGLGVVVLFQIAWALVVAKAAELMSVPDSMIGNYGGNSLLIFVMIASTAGIISSEFQYGTIKQLLYRQYYRSQVFVSKVCALLIQALVLKAVAIVVGFGMTLLTPALNAKVDLMGTYQKQPFMNAYWLAQAGNLLTMLLILSFVLLVSTILKTNAAAIAAGFIGYLVAYVASVTLLAAIAQWHWVKWNPLTFMLTETQILSPSYAKATLLSTPQMLTGSVVYTLLFGVLAYLSFRRRSV